MCEVTIETGGEEDLVVWTEEFKIIPYIIERREDIDGSE